MLIRIVVLILLVSAQLFAMVSEDFEEDQQQFDLVQIIPKNENNVTIAEEEHGLTLKEAYDFLYERAKYPLWHYKRVLLISAISSPFSVVLFGLPNYVAAGLYCNGQTGKYNCLDTCAGDNQCRSRCWDTNFTSYDDPICQATLTLSFVSLLPVIVVACSKPIAKLQNWFANTLNEKTNNYLVQFVYRGRSFDQRLNDEDMLLVGPILLAEQSNLLKKLSSSQALALAPIDPKKFKNIVDKFSPDAQVSANKLFRLLEMDLDQLVLTLKDKEMIDYFKKNPILWQSLVRIIYQKKSMNTDVIEAIHLTLKEISGLTREKTEEWDNILRQIIAGTSIREFIGVHFKLAKFVVGEEKLADDEVMLTTNDGQPYRVKKKLLIEKSGYFSAALNGPWAKGEDFSKFDSDLLKILFLVIEEKLIITINNVRTVLEAAAFFQMESVANSCDTFIFELDIFNDALKPLFAHEKKEFGKKESPFKIRWKFCKKHQLPLNQHALATQMLADLGDLQWGDHLSLLDAELMLQSDISAAMASFNEERFSEKLKDPKFLGWLWPRVKNIAFLKACVVDFCADHQNARIVESAFPIIPEELRAEIDEVEKI